MIFAEDRTGKRSFPIRSSECSLPCQKRMTTLLGMGESLGLVGVAAMLIILGLLSRRLGAVLKLPPAYRWAYAGAVLVSVAALADLVRVAAIAEESSFPAWVTASGFLLGFVYLPLSMGLLAGLVVVWRYWRWLLTRSDH